MDARWIRLARNGFCLLVFGLILARTTLQIPMFPNWDMMGYMGVAQEWAHDDPVDVHRTTYEAARKELPTEAFLSLVDPRQSVRKARYDDPVAFHEHLAFYRARVLPTLMMQGMFQLGLPLSKSLWWINLGSYAATAILMLVWIARRLPLGIAALIAALLAQAPPLLTTAMMSTSDGLATLLLCAGLWCVAERRRLKLGTVLLVLSVLSRPDSVILIGFWGLVTWFLERRNQDRLPLPALGGILAVSVVAYLGVQNHAREYGWWPLFHISFLQKEAYPSQIATDVDFAAYSSKLAEKANEIPGVGYFLQGSVRGSSYPFVYAGFTLLALALARRFGHARRLARAEAILIAMLVAFSLRWFLFPQLWDRFFAPMYVLVPLVLLSMACDALDESGSAGPDSPNEPDPAPDGGTPPAA